MTYTYPYRVELTIGPYTWTRHAGDAPALPEILDGLAVGWQFPDGDLWPPQPEPVTSSFSLLAYTADDLDQVNIGTPLHLQVYAGAVNADGDETPTVRLAGRVSQLNGHARSFLDPADGETTVQGWQLDVQAAAYDADPAEVTVTAIGGNYGNEPIATLQRILNLSAPAYTPSIVVPDGVSPTDPQQGDGSVNHSIDLDGTGGFNVGTGPNLVTGATVNDQAYGPASLADTFDANLSLWPEAGPYGAADPSNPANHPLYKAYGWRRGIYRAKVDADGIPDPATPWRVEWVSRRNPSTLAVSALPLKFAAHDGVYGPVPGPPNPAVAEDASMVLDAAWIDYSADWQRTKTTEPNRVVVGNGVADDAQVTWQSVSVSDALPGGAVVTAQIDSAPIVDAYWARFLADMYNGDDEQESTSVRWTAGSMTWYASQDPSWPRNPALFPDAEMWLGHSLPVLVDNIPATQKPTPGRYVGGPVKSVQFALSGGDFAYTLALYSRIPRPANNLSAATWANLAAANWTQLDDADWITYRLVHNTALD